MTQAALDRAPGTSMPRIALVSGVLAAILFFGVAFQLEGGWWLAGPPFGLIAVIAALTAKRRGERLGLASLIASVVGAIVFVWFAAYMIVDAVA